MNETMLRIQRVTEDLKAVEAELRRQDLLAETDRYLNDLVAEVGAPSPGQRARAGAVVRRMVQRTVRKVG